MHRKLNQQIQKEMKRIYDDEYELLDSATYKDSTEKVKFPGCNI